jgi:hypothetical protein
MNSQLRNSIQHYLRFESVTGDLVMGVTGVSAPRQRAQQMRLEM